MSGEVPAQDLPPLPSSQDPSPGGPQPSAAGDQSVDRSPVYSGHRFDSDRTLADMPMHAAPQSEREWRRTHRTGQLVNLVFGIAELLIGLRFFLQLFGANPDAAFTRAVYAITAPLIAPFLGVFPDPQRHGSIFEFASLLALIVYALLNRIIVRFLYLRRSSGQA
jgi:hypothetical protein